MSDQSANLALPFLAAGQAQKHVTVNESLLRLDALVQLSVTSASVAAQPGAPVDGELYILPAGKTGAAWGGIAEQALAYWRDGVWEEITPREGWLAFVRDAELYTTFNGATWTPLGPGAAFKAGLTADQSTIADATWTKINFDTEAFDRAGDYDAPNARHTPQAARPHEWRLTLQWTANAVAGQTVGVAIKKNGAYLATNVAAVTLSGNFSLSVSTLDIPDGETDYYEAWGYIDTIGGANATVQAGSGSVFYGKQV